MEQPSSPFNTMIDTASRPAPGRHTPGSRRWLPVVIVVVAGVSLAIAAGDARQIGDALGGFTWRLILPVLLLTLWNYAWRFLKWHRYLRQVGEGDLPPRLSLLIFLSAFSMSVTPGKIGELIKATELRRLRGTPVSRTTAIVAAERLTDAVAMLILASVGAVQFAQARLLLAAVAVIAAMGMLLLRHPRLLLHLIDRLGSLPVIGRPRDYAGTFFASAGPLMGTRSFVGATVIGVVAWLGECTALFIILLGFDLSPSWHLFLVAVFTLAVSSLAGALSLLPGGLGVAEASVAGLLLLLVHDDRMTGGVAAAATLIIRFATLWFAVALGVAALALCRRGARPNIPGA
jgi:uncharacterized membrane protein YbhN (UPF0104 family)